MGMTMRVSLPGYNALTDGTIDHYALYADTDNVLLKEQSRGTLASGGSISHSLGYIPFYLVYGSVAAGKYMLASGYDAISGIPRSYSTNNILFTAGAAVKYFVFYDDMS